ncbi:hypothetical protein MOQ72_31380 [Saccharopolyspora sp. K220]|uniref:hypothetical protein n=1 Tax=Saccharopolyspora soli TaxID=2926618 RepID=UPI001F595F73|nr:hypothetical protein [Saccharopolyspora soli]MCI2421946.1 hypothetical protein [Saccharopolyspora soli]
MTAPQNPWQQQQFQSAAYQQLPPQQQFDRPNPPRTVVSATLIGIVVPILSAVLTVISFVLNALELIRYTDDWLGPVMFMVANTLGTLALAVLWVIFALQMRAGRNWSRTTLAILAVVWLLYSLFGITVMLTQGPLTTHASAILTILDSSMAAIAMLLFLILVFLKPSNQYFKATNNR